MWKLLLAVTLLVYSTTTLVEAEDHQSTSAIFRQARAIPLESSQTNKENEEPEEETSGDEDSFNHLREAEERERAFKGAKKFFKKYAKPLLKKLKPVFKILFGKLLDFLEDQVATQLVALGLSEKDVKELLQAFEDGTGIRKLFDDDKDIGKDVKEEIIAEFDKASSDDYEEVKQFIKGIGTKITVFETKLGLEAGSVKSELDESIAEAERMITSDQDEKKNVEEAVRIVAKQIAAAAATGLCLKKKEKKRAATTKHSKPVLPFRGVPQDNKAVEETDEKMNGDGDSLDETAAYEAENKERAFAKAKKFFKKYGKPLLKKLKPVFKILFGKLLDFLEDQIATQLVALGLSEEDVKELVKGFEEGTGIRKLFDDDKDIDKDVKEEIIPELEKASSDNYEEVKNFIKGIGTKITVFETKLGLEAGSVNSKLDESITEAERMITSDQDEKKNVEEAVRIVAKQIAAAAATGLCLKKMEKKRAAAKRRVATKHAKRMLHHKIRAQH